ncbi:malonyl-CoA decarboxylase domain-containing protein [Paracoccus alkenifer]|uniref:Malonyl-CoA decarboxylase n=1 Tax=Paracoccus alkenifer TaxID=65735 RepID=A0A1H6N4M0_9RHOB|nr:malonyl-CoA decarboxylase family protein [Paracoccus alkenifer]SEI05109.1 malonyl-CoA decarboxylase [Paracoccus alkenifer]
MGRLSFFTGMMSGLFERVPRRGAPRGDAGSGAGITELSLALLSAQGEVSGTRLAGEILDGYRGLDPGGRAAFFGWMAGALDVEPAAIIAAAERYRDAPDRRSYTALAEAAEPRRQELLRRLNQAPGATLDLVRMRLDLLRLLPDHPELAVLDVDFRHLFRSWFNRGFLVLRPIDWHTPANILEKIVEYEAVHAIDDWSDLQRRVMPEDRRCFAFFHPSMLEEPLIFVEVALCRGIPSSVQDLLAENRVALDDEDTDTAVFYSISNCQEGLRGISFGNSLIKQVVAELHQELPQLHTFVTLSPIPGLMGHLRAQDDDAARRLVAAADAGDRAAIGALSDDLRTHAASWLAEQKRPGGAPADPVARFHLGNGAELHLIHALADVSAQGLAQSASAMVSYLYDLNRVEANHEAFAAQNTVAMSREIKALLSRGKQTGKTKE